MKMKEFQASMPGDDYRGTISAYRAERSGFQQWLIERGLARKGEYLLGVELLTRENHGTHIDPVRVIALMANRGEYASIQEMIGATCLVAVRPVSVEMPLLEFFGLFRQLSIALSSNGTLTNRRYAYFEVG